MCLCAHVFELYNNGTCTSDFRFIFQLKVELDKTFASHTHKFALPLSLLNTIPSVMIYSPVLCKKKCTINNRNCATIRHM